MRRLLLVDDEPRILEALRRMLRTWRGDWDLHVAGGGKDALAQLEAGRFDVVITDMRMPGMDGAELLARVADRCPQTIRIILSGQTEVEAAARAIPVAHQFLSKPCDPSELRDVVERAFALRDLLADPTLRGIVGAVDALPVAPATWLALGRALRDPSAGVTQIAELVELDAALAASVLHLVNSSFFGQRREVTSVVQATTLLGTGLIRSLALAQHVFSRGAGPGHSGGELERERAHGVAVGCLARLLVQDRSLEEAAFTAGLLHDLGKLILGTGARAEVLAARRQSAAEKMPLHVVEEARCDVSHAEVGAYLLGLWGVPHLVVEAVAHHHRPGRVAAGDRRVLLAVHVADAVVHGHTDGEGAGTALLAEAVLDEAGWADRVDLARTLVATIDLEAL